uniref:Ig-like domain-containing protein n=1 Tax=Neolamprologus brichardi TaxID=32507 RepID=A0A3Q4I545_NEOBR
MTLILMLIFSVLDIPKLPSVSVSPSAEIVEGSSVTLTCSSDANPAANYTWYKEQQPISQEKQIIFRSIWFSDSGKYCCTAENELVEGSSVTLTCSSDANPAANYTWYKEQNRSVESSITPSGETGDDSPVTLTRSTVNAPKPPSVSVRPSGEIKEGTSVTLTCSSDANPAATFVWYKTNGRTPLSKEPQLFFRSIQRSDSGQYYCIAGNTVGSRTSEYVSINVKCESASTSPRSVASRVFTEIKQLNSVCFELFVISVQQNPDHNSRRCRGSSCSVQHSQQTSQTWKTISLADFLSTVMF